MLSVVTRSGTEATLTFTWPTVVLQLYAGAVRRRVHVDHHGVGLQLGLLGRAGRAETIEA